MLNMVVLLLYAVQAAPGIWRSATFSQGLFRDGRQGSFICVTVHVCYSFLK